MAEAETKKINRIKARVNKVSGSDVSRLNQVRLDIFHLLFLYGKIVPYKKIGTMRKEEGKHLKPIMAIFTE